MIGNSAEKPLVLSLSARLEECGSEEIYLRVNEYSFIIVLRNCVKLKTCDEAVRR